MDIDFSEMDYLKDPLPQTLKADYEQFLLSIIVPTVIDITGVNESKCRVIITLLHGNEPSGFIAIHRWLTIENKAKPQTNLRFIICSVEAASQHPLLSSRFLIGGKDINRCFGSDFNEGYFLRANLIEKAIREVSPEAVIDLHNTSGTGPSFTVSTLITTDVLSLASLFSQTIILSNLKLGALMEQDLGCPVITVECGGCSDEQAHEVAFAGIKALSKCNDISQLHQTKTVEVIYKPLRLKVKPDKKISFAEHDEGYSDVTLKKSIENFNFGSAHQGEMLGWLDGKGLENLELMENGKNVISEYFTLRENQLVCATNLRIFMATTNKTIAKNDCLFYVVKLPNSKI